MIVGSPTSTLFSVDSLILIKETIQKLNVYVHVPYLYVQQLTFDGMETTCQQILFRISMLDLL